jgi:hypothetical protein
LCPRAWIVYKVVPNGQRLTGKKEVCPHPQTRLTCGATVEDVYNLQFYGFTHPNPQSIPLAAASPTRPRLPTPQSRSRLPTQSQVRDVAPPGAVELPLTLATLLLGVVWHDLSPSLMLRSTAKAVAGERGPRGSCLPRRGSMAGRPPPASAVWIHGGATPTRAGGGRRWCEQGGRTRLSPSFAQHGGVDPGQRRWPRI